MSADLIRIMIADDHPLLREGVAAVLANQKDMQVVAEAGNGIEAVDLFCRHVPDITLMDLQMPCLNGVDAIRAIRTHAPEARIIVLTTYSGDMQASRALRAGAAGYLLKGMDIDEPTETIRAVHAGKKRIPPDIANELAEHAADDELTEREIDVLRLIAGGNSNKQIADKLSVGEATIKSHVTNILSKLGANDRSHAVTIGLKRGIVEL